MHNQKGMTMIGWVVVIAIILLLALGGLRLLPVYLEYFKIDSVLRDLSLRDNSETRVTPKSINEYLQKRFDVEGINVIQPSEISIKREDSVFLVKADYDHVVAFIGNVNFLVEFEKEVKVAR
ncbi:MAG: DUF4845 domain-containing protein [Gammaproteobacteria bacterium]|nr:DUF4845 domain-containing protein [Gammaproteobacteria bacterium]